MRKPVVFLFSGQGSQYYQMGRDLYHSNASFKRHLDELDDFVYECSGISVISQMYGDKRKGDLFDNILYTHPALFMVQYALAAALTDSGVVPSYVIGSSLGEYVAAAVSGAVNAEDMLKCIIKQSHVFTDLSAPGKMVAVIENYEKIRHVINSFGGIELASLDGDSHFVVSGPAGEVTELEQYLRNNQVIFQELSVRYPFHSGAIENLKTSIITLFREAAFKSADVKFISGMNADEMHELSPEYLWRVVRHRINFSEAARFLYAHSDCVFADLSPSGTMANLLKISMPSDCGSEIINFMSPFAGDNMRYERSLHKLLES